MIVKDEVQPSRVELSDAQRALLEERLQRARQTSARGAETRSSIPRRGAVAEIPLSFAQERLWFLDQLEPGSAVYNVCQAVRISGPLDSVALEKALNDVVRRHEILRTNVRSVDGRPVQVIAPERTIAIASMDASAWGEGPADLELQRRLREESRRPFNFERDLLLRALLVRLSPTESVLMLTMHHIISDGWSLGILFRELAALYAGYCSGQLCKLPELPIQFADFVLWEREHVHDAALERALAYWKKQLGGTLPVLELPLDHPRSATATSRGALQSLTLSRTLTGALKTFGQQEGATLFMTLLAAFQVLLHRWSGQEDIVVGSVVAGRRKVELEKLIGFFVNTLVLRGDLAGNPTFRELLARVRDSSLAALAHQDLPFERLVKELRPDRTVGRNPLFQVMFVLQNAPMAPTDLPGLSLEPIDVDTGTTKFDLTLSMMETPQGLRAGFEYNADLFEPATIARMLGCFQTLLEDAVANPATPIARLALLGAAEREEIVTSWNRTRRAFPREQTLHAQVEAQVARNPAAVALSFSGATVTYGELNARANQLAHRLRRLGIGPDTLVALCLERSPEMIVALLGILKAGGAYLSLDPSYPAERLAFMLADSQAPVVLTVASLRPVVPAGGAERSIINLDTEWPDIARESAANPAPLATGENLAYVSYTSGSTGKPKGVCIPHRAVSRLLINTDYVQLGADDVVAQISNCAFDASTFEVWGALLHGGRLAVIPRTVVLEPAVLAKTLVAEGVTAMFVTTALFNQLAQTTPGIFQSLRHVLFGGEAANPVCVREVLRASPPRRLLHVYGPTETTTFATWLEVREVPAGATTVPIGRPLANTTLYVLDTQGQPVPVGVPGELHIGGDGVARGYLRRPELEAARFIADPFAGEAGARLYKTGDRVRWLPDGTLEFLGRLDRQVKIRGFRIEPDEIEIVLERHPAVKQAAVMVREAAAGDRQLIAYVAGPAVDVAELRQHLQATLPDYMVPAVFVKLDALPLNANGKVDRDALPAPEATDRTGAYCAPRDAVEREVAEIWAQVLGVAQVGLRDRFFDLGGHSLLAVKMVGKLEERFGRRLPVAAIFQHGTVEELARLLRPDGAAYRSATSIVDIQGQGTRAPLYLVHGVGGGMFWGYANLARHLGTGQPVLAFKSRGLEGQPEWPSIVDMATNYLADLRSRQPNGPYLIGGYCFGGIVAYEMARQLEAQGEKVGLLALINCSPPNTTYERVPQRRSWAWRRKFLRNLGYWLGCFLFTWTWRERAEFIRWKLRLIRKRTTWLQHASALAVTDVDEMVNLTAYSEEQRQLWQTHVKALRSYVPHPFGGHVTLFRTRGHAFFCSFDELYGWGPLAGGGVTVRIVPGGHGNILDEPHVRTVARELAAELEAADRSGRATSASAQPAPANIANPSNVCA